MSSMKLSDFIKASLLEVAEGLRDAQEELNAFGAVINPYRSQNENEQSPGADWVQVRGGLVPVQSIKFDLAVTGSSETKIGAGAEAKGKANLILVVSGEVGADVTLDHSREKTTVHHLQFDVRIAWPSGQATGG